MAGGEKPYRVYRGGRVKGKVPLQPRPDGAQPPSDGRGAGRRRPPRPRRPRGPGTWTKKHWILLTLGLVFVLLVVWAATSYLAFSQGVSAANKRLDERTRRTLTSQGGLLLSHPTTILLLGTDHANTDQRAADRHSDSIMLVRTDPGRHRIAYLSVMRDLRVAIPGYGDGKINAAVQFGGPALAVRTVEGFTGLKVNHVVIVDFGAFADLIDKVGGITVNVPERILSNRFDCPFATAARCDRWQGWRFAKGPQHMNGGRALIYSRIRENRLNPAESDATRTERQQAVLQALTGKLSGIGAVRPGVRGREPDAALTPPVLGNPAV